jgi:hypothetical protein
MRTVMYKNPNAIFDFLLPDVIDRLKYYSEQNVRDATKILASIDSSASKVIEVGSDYFGFIVLDLIKAGKGHAYCNACKQMHDSSQLTSRPLGFGRSPFEVNIKEKGGIINRLFRKKRHISGTGGEAYDCPKGHQLIGMITWIS